MSTQPELSVADAESVLLNHIYIPVLLNKVAEFGIVPQNEADAVAIVKMAAQLRTLHEQSQLQAGNNHSNLLQKAAAKLDQAITGQPAVSPIDALIKQAAKEAAQVPQYAAAALALAKAGAV